jgi:hypothetical protein
MAELQQTEKEKAMRLCCPSCQSKSILACADATVILSIDNDGDILDCISDPLHDYDITEYYCAECDHTEERLEDFKFSMDEDELTEHSGKRFIGVT